MTHESVPLTAALILEWGAFVYAGYAGFRGWRPRYTLAATLLLGLLAGTAAGLWAPEPPGAPVLVPVAALGIGTMGKWLSGEGNRTGRWTGRITLAALLLAAALFTAAYVM